MIAICIGGALAFISSAGSIKAILSIVRAAEAIGEGRLDTHLEIGRSDELGTLAGSINRMALALKESYQELESRVANAPMTSMRCIRL